MPFTAYAEPTITWDQKYYNPAPAEDDFILPMPCGGAMAFRKIYVASQGPLYDEKIRLGFLGDENKYAEYWRDAYISGAFESENGEAARYYLLGKYEISKMQYQALTRGECPKVVTKMSEPAVKMTWFDAMSTADKYNLWLMENVPDALPKEGDYSGYIRLPTEEEWEFAARGGHKVSAAEFTDPVFPMTEDLNRYVWFSGPRSKKKTRGGISDIGLLKPNPLGLHDILGNAGEMVFDPFRLRKLNRSHGQAGGYVIRGGDINTPQASIRTSLRVERPFYKNGKPWTSSTTGFRLVITAPVINSKETLNEIQDEWSKLGATESKDAIDNLKVITSEIEDTEQKKRLEEIRAKFAAEQEASKENMALAARGALKLGGYLCSRLGEQASKFEGTKKLYENCVKDFSEAECKEMGYDRMEQDEENFLGFLNYYADTIVDTYNIFKTELINTQFPLLKKIKAEKGREKDMPYVETFKTHIELYEKNGVIDRNTWLTKCRTLWEEE